MQYIIGKPRTGKTTYLIQQFLSARAGAFFDFSGDTDTLLSLIPPERYDDTVLFFPFDTEYPIGLNVLHNPQNIPRIANAVLETIKSTWHYEGSTPLLDMYTYASVAALCYVPDATLLGIPYLLTDTAYREKVTGHITDPVLKHFWDDFYPSIPERDRRHDTMSTLNKVFALITDPTIRNIIGQKHTSFTIKDTSIIIASFPHSLGKEKASFLATLLLYSLPDTFTVLDGGHHLGPPAVLEKKNILFSHQYIHQLTESMRETLIGTADEMICFRIGPTDNLRLEREFEIDRNTTTLTDLLDWRYHKKGARVEHSLSVDPLPDPLRDPAKLLHYSRENNCSPRAHVEASIAKFYH